MNPEFRALLDDLFRAEPNGDFREASRAAMLRGVRRRRRRRRVQNILAAVAVAALAVTGLWWGASERYAAPEVSGPGQPSGAAEQMPAVATVRSQAGKVTIVVSDPGTVVLVRTGDLAGRWREISDDELLALFAGQGAALVRSDGRAFVVAAGRRVGELPEPVN